MLAFSASPIGSTPSVGSFPQYRYGFASGEEKVGEEKVASTIFRKDTYAQEIYRAGKQTPLS